MPHPDPTNPFGAHLSDTNEGDDFMSIVSRLHQVGAEKEEIEHYASELEKLADDELKGAEAEVAKVADDEVLPFLRRLLGTPEEPASEREPEQTDESKPDESPQPTSPDTETNKPVDVPKKPSEPGDQPPKQGDGSQGH